MSLTRREAMVAGLAGGLLAPPGLRAWASPAPSPMIADMRTNGVANPLLLETQYPRFSWVIGSGAKTEGQSAYRILVAGNEDDLTAGSNLLWDSGRIASSRNFDIAYSGAPLPARTRAVWCAEVWTGGQPRPYRSAAASLETGIGDPTGWDAEWLAGETETARLDRAAGIHWVGGSKLPRSKELNYFRARIDGGEGGAAELLLSANRTEGVWLNGTTLKADQVWPADWTAMARYPLTLRAGTNHVAVAVRRSTGFGTAPPLLAAILRHGPGLRQRLSSSAGWTTATEAADGWEQPDFDDGAWEPALPQTKSLPVGEPWPDYPANHLRRAFTLARPVARARLYATALGVYEALLNGKPVDDRKLAPEFTDPSKHVLYQAYDVTSLLAAGENILGFTLGNGWYGGKYSTSGRFAFGPAPCRLIARLEIDYADGTTDSITTGRGWEIAEGAIRADSLYDGEVHDARLARPDWAVPGGGGPGWREALVVPAPSLSFLPQVAPPIRAHEAMPPRSVKRLQNGNRVFDFGQNFAGWPRLEVRAPAGNRIDLRFAESLRPDGGVDQGNLRTAQQHDVYICAGKGRETWQPAFTYHGFRYAEVSGLPDADADWSFSAVAGYQGLEVTGAFRTADPVIRKFWQNSLWSQKSNFWGLPTDCPQRDERLGWMGDAQVFWEAAAFNMDVAAYTARVMQDVRSGQRENGAFPDCIPPFVPTVRLSSPGWADAGVIMPYVSWRQNGDTAVIDAQWEAMERYLAWIAAGNPDHLWTKSRGADYGDWLAVDASAANPGSPTTPKDLIGTAFWSRDASMMAEMAAATGRTEAAERYRALFGQVRAAFNAAYVRPDGTIGNESQTSYILPIHFGLLGPEAEREAARRLVAGIAARGGHLSTGFLGTPYILDALARTGHEQTAVSLLLERGFPSWGYMVEKGATSMWERWDSDSADGGMNSLNHYAFGAITSFLFRRIAGIAAAAQGFSKVRIEPIMDARLGSAGATYRSASGTIRTDWAVESGRFRLDVELPPGIAGDVLLPGGKGAAARPGLNRFSGMLS